MGRRGKEPARTKRPADGQVEYIVVAFNDEQHLARVSLRQAEILEALAKDEALQGGRVETCYDCGDDSDGAANGNGDGSGSGSGSCTPGTLPTFHPEYGRFMLEATPGAPFGSQFEELLLVEPDMQRRRVIASQHMRGCEYPMTITSFPLLGVGDFCEPHYDPTGPASRSLFLPDEAINPHVRFPTLTSNIRSRRGEKVAINIPIFHDTNTPRPFVDPTIPRDRNLYPEDSNARDGAALPDHIYMDSMGFGMGCCCLQITFQTKDVDEARNLFDQLVPVAPIMMAVSAASPIFRGYLADQDCRWNVVSASVDDRTREERRTISKSRYDSISAYISNDVRMHEEYNDVPLEKNEPIRERLLRSGIDERMADHISHLFIRDPLVVFSDSLDQDDATSADHFESINTSNWQSIRFKPPPPGSSIGWRVEFRTMEVQVTDFENAAFSVFIVLLTRAILSFGLNLYMPISLVDENMRRAHGRGACINEKFWFRKNILDSQTSAAAEPCRQNGASEPGLNGSLGQSRHGGLRIADGEFVELTCDELLNGQKDRGPDAFPGLATIVRCYLDSTDVQMQTKCQLLKYVDLVSQRAAGTIPTAATWIREYCRKHPEYKHDSRIPPRVNYDLLRKLRDITIGDDREACASLIGSE